MEDDSLDWLFSPGDSGASNYPAFISQVGALAMASSTYEWMVRHAEKVIEETGSPWPSSQPKWVFTNRKLPLIKGAEIRFFEGNVSQAHGEMRSLAGARNIWIVGGDHGPLR
jgi:uncharacterized protein YbjT (DUF2867 family)